MIIDSKYNVIKTEGISPLVAGIKKFFWNLYAYIFTGRIVNKTLKDFDIQVAIKNTSPSAERINDIANQIFQKCGFEGTWKEDKKALAVAKALLDLKKIEVMQSTTVQGEAAKNLPNLLGAPFIGIEGLIEHDRKAITDTLYKMVAQTQDSIPSLDLKTTTTTTILSKTPKIETEFSIHLPSKVIKGKVHMSAELDLKTESVKEIRAITFEPGQLIANGKTILSIACHPGQNPAMLEVTTVGDGSQPYTPAKFIKTFVPTEKEAS